MMTKTEVENLMDHTELLYMFLNYVEQCIDDSSNENKIHPVSFDEWYNLKYLPNIDTLTSVVEVTVSYEGAANGTVNCTNHANVQLRIPADIVTETGGIINLSRFCSLCKRFAETGTYRMPTVRYRGDRTYHWAST